MHDYLCLSNSLQCYMDHQHYVHSPCRDKLPERKCGECSGTAFQHSKSMDYVVENKFVPCKHGCDENFPYYMKKSHEKECPNGPCFCPEASCGFAGLKAELLDHAFLEHKWVTKSFEYYKSFGVPANPGMQILRGEDGYLFLLSVVKLEYSSDLKVSLVCLQPNPPEPKFGFSFSYSWGGHLSTTVSSDQMAQSSLSDGPPEDYCLLPSGVTAVLKQIHITRWSKMTAWEDDDDDTSYTEGDDEGGEGDAHSDA